MSVSVSQSSTTFINSTILTKAQGLALSNLIGIPLNSQASLLYRASRDGFGAINFHSKVNGILGTYVIIKTTNENIFGGYTKANWGSGGYVNDTTAYIFSLVNAYNQPCVLNVIPTASSTAAYTVAGQGPSFGGGFDFLISDQSNSNTDSSSALGHTYQLPSGFTKANANSFLAGNVYFQTVEIEVYSITGY